MRKKAINSAMVRRITVDEKLFEDIIRLEICELIDGVEEFEDASMYWKDGEAEEGVQINPDNFSNVMGIPQSQTNNWHWKDLKEGQVFLSGSFEVKGEAEALKTFILKPGKEEFIRIDDIVKKEIEKLYYEAIERRK